MINPKSKRFCNIVWKSLLRAGEPLTVDKLMRRVRRHYVAHVGCFHIEIATKKLAEEGFILRTSNAQGHTLLEPNPLQRLAAIR